MVNENILLLLTGGSGSRFGAGLPKQFLEIDFQSLNETRKTITRTLFEKHRKLLLYELTLRAFLKSFSLEHCVITFPREYIDSPYVKDSIKNLQVEFSKTRFSAIEGGKNRHGSFIHAADYLITRNIIDKNSKTSVLVHDGNRPFIDESFQKNITAILANSEKKIFIPVTQSVNSMVESSGNKVDRYLDRSFVFDVQTPQIIPASVIYNLKKEDYEESTEYTDEGSFFLKKGHDVFIFDGSLNNIKITYPQDLIDDGRKP